MICSEEYELSMTEMKNGGYLMNVLNTLYKSVRIAVQNVNRMNRAGYGGHKNGR
jgi:hypothetical protein